MNAKRNDGETYLHRSAENGHLEVARAPIDTGLRGARAEAGPPLGALSTDTWRSREP